MAKRDLTGMRFGRLVALCDDGTRDKHKNVMWKCQCDCGNIAYVRTSFLTRKNRPTLSCGCLQKEAIKNKWKEEDFKQKHSDKMRELNEKQWKDEDFKQRQSDKTRKLNEKQWQNEEFRQMHRDKAKEQWKEEDFKQKHSDKMREVSKQLWQDEEFRRMHSDRMREAWEDEEYREAHSGENSHTWKGGISPISTYLRNLEFVDNWKIRAYIETNGCCEISDKKVRSDNGEVHHIKPFSEIVIEAHTLNNIEIKQVISDYSEEDLETLKNYVAEWHKDITNAIVLHKDVHQYFHNVFMKGKDRESSVEDVEEFKQRYLDGEFSDLF